MKKNLKELRQSLNAKKVQGRSKLQELNGLNDKAALSAEETTRRDVLDTEVTAIEREVETLNATIANEERNIGRAVLFGTAARTINDPNPVTTWGFKGLAEFAGCVRRAGHGDMDPRLAASASDPNVNQGSAGEGFMVPPEYRQRIWEIATDPVDLLGRVDLEPTVSNSIIMPKDETTPWGSTGVQALWRAEAGVMTASKAATTGNLIKLEELYAFVVASEELLQDAPRLENRLTNKAAQAIRWKASDSIMWGDGNAKPLGFMTAGSLITVAKDSGDSTATVSVPDLGNMLARLLYANADSAFWMINSGVLPALMQLTIGNQPVWTPPGTGMQEAPAGRLLGKPMMISEHCKTLGTPGDIVLVDGMGYGAANKADGISFATSIHLYFDQNLTAFRWTFRLAGQPYLSAAVVPPKDSGTARGPSKSQFIALATRP